MRAPDASNTDNAAGRALGAGAFLACSWTWCIGMFLPVILIREFGWTGWAFFAAPNVLGAMLMGVTLRRRGASEARIASWRAGPTLFSAVTLAFHAFFLTWFMAALVAPLAGPYAVIAPALLAFAVGWGVSGGSWRAWRTGGVVVLVLSLAFGALAWMTSGGLMAPPERTGASDTFDLLWLTPVMVFGFALCPYLDLTFHRARQEERGGVGTAAFVVGFGVMFLAMIVLTLLYAPAMLRGPVSYYIAAHVMMQTVFTVGAHVRELRLRDARTLVSTRSITLTSLLLGVTLALAALTWTRFGRLPSGETLYKCFMGAYGLLFPTLVWTWSAGGRVFDRAAGAAALGAILLASPFFWLGFVEQNWVWLGPGLLLALCAPIAARTLRRAGRKPSANL